MTEPYVPFVIVFIGLVVVWLATLMTTPEDEGLDYPDFEEKAMGRKRQKLRLVQAPRKARYGWDPELGQYVEIPDKPILEPLGGRRKRGWVTTPYSEGWDSFDIKQFKELTGEELSKLCPYPKDGLANIEWWRGWYESAKFDWYWVKREETTDAS